MGCEWWRVDCHAANAAKGAVETGSKAVDATVGAGQDFVTGTWDYTVGGTLDTAERVTRPVRDGVGTVYGDVAGGLDETKDQLISGSGTSSGESQGLLRRGLDTVDNAVDETTDIPSDTAGAAASPLLIGAGLVAAEIGRAHV